MFIDSVCKLEKVLRALDREKDSYGFNATLKGAAVFISDMGLRRNKLAILGHGRQILGVR